MSICRNLYYVWYRDIAFCHLCKYRFIFVLMYVCMYLFLYMGMYVPIYFCTWIWMYLFFNIVMWVCMYFLHICTYLSIYFCTYARIYFLYICTYVRIYFYTYVCTIYVCMCVCMYVWMDVWMYVLVKKIIFLPFHTSLFGKRCSKQFQRFIRNIIMQISCRRCEKRLSLRGPFRKTFKSSRSNLTNFV
jgi:hypothetical protein